MKTIFPIISALSLLCASCAADSSSSDERKASVVEETWFKHIDGEFEKAEYIDITPGSADRLYFRYGPTSDSGVELERSINNVILWRVHVQRLGLSHSAYSHQVFVRVGDGEIRVSSLGARQIFEVRDLKSGELIRRTVTDDKGPRALVPGAIHLSD